MPTRYLKPGICDSEAIDRCSPLAECLFYRLLVNVDDFGRLDGRPAVIRAKCFPLKDTVKNSDITAWLQELHANYLILLYEVNGAPFLQINKWDNVPRSQTSKCPAPPTGAHPAELLEIISENDLEDAICIHIDNSREFAGLQVHSWARQVRHGESYFDMVLETNIGQVGVELKRARLSKKAVEQAIKYAALSNIPFLLIGAGLGVGVDISNCEAGNVCVATYNQDFIASVIGGVLIGIKRDFTLKQVSALTVTVTVTETETETETDNRKPELKPETGTATVPPRKKRVALENEILPDEIQDACRKTWKAYSDAYFERYKTEPVRNATVNTQVKSFVKRLGAEESQHVAAFFVRSNSAFYVQRGHVFGNLLADAEKMRTEWATGSSMTATRARQLDQSQANSNVVGEALKILEEQNRAENT